MKCIPITLSGLFVTAAIFVKEIEEVLEAKITSFLTTLSKVLNICFFNSKSSTTALMDNKNI